MPYIPKKNRERLDILLKTFYPDTAGEFNYCVFKLALNYLRHQGLNYQSLNDLEGALQNCSKEIYRRISCEYEKLKITDNGDVEGISELLDKVIASMLVKKDDDKN